MQAPGSTFEMPSFFEQPVSNIMLLFFIFANLKLAACAETFRPSMKLQLVVSVRSRSEAVRAAAAWARSIATRHLGCWLLLLFLFVLGGGVKKVDLFLLFLGPTPEFTPKTAMNSESGSHFVSHTVAVRIEIATRSADAI